MSTLVRIDDSLHAELRIVAEREGRPIGRILEDAFSTYQRAQFWAGVRTDYERLRTDTGAYASWQQETDSLDSGTSGSLANEPPYYSADEEAEIRAARG